MKYKIVGRSWAIQLSPDHTMNSLSPNTNPFMQYSTSTYLSKPSVQPLRSPTDHREYDRHVTSSFRPNESSPTNINTVWTEDSFLHTKLNSKRDQNLNLQVDKMSWTNQKNEFIGDDTNTKVTEKIEVEVNVEGAVGTPSPTGTDGDSSSPSHHARRPMNAFLIFCKKHRPIVRKRYQNLENRGVTRILGEWWAQLDDTEKEPYKNLAQEYKDAFFSANPDFKWYKIPAPPLRTLKTRPTLIPKEPMAMSNPASQTSQHEAEFNPGKLADESQLGKLSSLLNITTFQGKSNEYDTKMSFDELQNHHNNNNSVDADNKNDYKQFHNLSTTNSQSLLLIPKPIKKRKLYESMTDREMDVRFTENTHLHHENSSFTELNCLKNGELINKVVDSVLTNHNANALENVGDSFDNSEFILKETRKSERLCKGRRYRSFMADGKLLKHKRDKRPTSFELGLLMAKPDLMAPKMDLGRTIKRLAERTHINLETLSEDGRETTENIQRHRSVSESSEDTCMRTKFNLELRIAALPNLDYDVYVQRKRDSKRKKFSKAKASEIKTTPVNNNNNNTNEKLLIGSKKRKNKNNITHLGKSEQAQLGRRLVDDLSGLTTLAEIAANKEKINQV